MKMRAVRRIFPCLSSALPPIYPSFSGGRAQQAYYRLALRGPGVDLPPPPRQERAHVALELAEAVECLEAEGQALELVLHRWPEEHLAAVARLPLRRGLRGGHRAPQPLLRQRQRLGIQPQRPARLVLADQRQGTPPATTTAVGGRSPHAAYGGGQDGDGGAGGQGERVGSRTRGGRRARGRACRLLVCR